MSKISNAGTKKPSIERDEVKPEVEETIETAVEITEEIKVDEEVKVSKTKTKEIVPQDKGRTYTIVETKGGIVELYYRGRKTVYNNKEDALEVVKLLSLK